MIRHGRLGLLVKRSIGKAFQAHFLAQVNDKRLGRNFLPGVTGQVVPLGGRLLLFYIRCIVGGHVTDMCLKTGASNGDPQGLGLYRGEAEHALVAYRRTFAQQLPLPSHTGLHTEAFHTLSAGNVFLQKDYIDFRRGFQLIFPLVARSGIPHLLSLLDTIVGKHLLAISRKLLQTGHVGFMNMTATIRRNVQQQN